MTDTTAPAAEATDTSKLSKDTQELLTTHVELYLAIIRKALADSGVERTPALEEAFKEAYKPIAVTAFGAGMEMLHETMRAAYEGTKDDPLLKLVHALDPSVIHGLNSGYEAALTISANQAERWITASVGIVDGYFGHDQATDAEAEK